MPAYANRIEKIEKTGKLNFAEILETQVVVRLVTAEIYYQEKMLKSSFFVRSKVPDFREKNWILFFYEKNLDWNMLARQVLTQGVRTLARSPRVLGGGSGPDPESFA